LGYFCITAKRIWSRVSVVDTLTTIRTRGSWVGMLAGTREFYPL